MDLGFEQAGFQILYAGDVEELFCETINANRKKYFGKNLIVENIDIRYINPSTLPDGIDFIIGGPPCQTFSASGRRAGGAAGQQDQRGTLFQAYGDIIEAKQPKGFLFENVRGILGSNKGEDWKEIKSYFSNLGYKLDYRIIDACDYGIAQHRERLILIGHRLDHEVMFPRPIFGPDSATQKPHITAEQAFKNVIINENINDLKLNGGKYSHLLPEVPPGGNYLFFTEKRGYPNPIFAYRSRFSDFLYKADPKKPTKTLIASPGKYTGPLHWENRYFSVAEYKRLQGFPDDYRFIGNRTEQIKQIGNSVSPILAKNLAISVKHQMFGSKLPSNIELIDKNYTLSFDKRKGRQAKKTRNKHLALAKKKKNNHKNKFQPYAYQATIAPNGFKRTKGNVKAQYDGADNASLTIRSDASRKLFAKMHLSLGKLPSSNFEVSLDISVYGSGDHSIQTMWNAIDDWVIKCSGYHSLFEIYGHFTEPHPDFKINRFESYSDHPICKFAEYASEFSNCSQFVQRSHLTSIFSDVFNIDQFLDLVTYLRQFRFDIRCKEINVAIDQDKYMIAYPFTLPNRKQMNFQPRNTAMTNTIKQDVSNDIKDKIVNVLEDAYQNALIPFDQEDTPESVHFDKDFKLCLNKISKKSETASSAFTNIVTGLSIKIAMPGLDVRYHQTQIQQQSKVGKQWFNHRGISEKVVYPWLSEKNFAGAKSGWQTRTLERPKPYTRDYDENIGYVKKEFLEVYERTEKLDISEIQKGLEYLLYEQLIQREKKTIDLATPNVDEISMIIRHLDSHINASYSGKGASRLPVLAVYATLLLVSKEIDRYKNVSLKPLEEHSAADSQTGSAGDIEFANSSNNVFEALEIKHNIVVTETLILDIEKKIAPYQLDRYYVLTTANDCKPDESMLSVLNKIKQRIGCQIIVNGVLPTIQYYLRLVTEPQKIYKEYTTLLQTDKAVSHEHREGWNEIILSSD